jgi:signal transduction histidine kinase
MTIRTLTAMVLGALLCGMGAVHAEEEKIGKEQIEKVVTLVERSVKLLSEAPDEKAAFVTITKKESDFVDGELYPFVMNLDGIMLAHINKKLVGKNFLKIKDVNGNNFMATFVEVAKSDKGCGWVPYTWPKPGARKGSPKVSYIMRVPGKDRLVGAGIYDVTMEDIEEVRGRQE